MFSAQTYIERRQKLREQIQSGLVLFLGNEESPMNYEDNPFHYRQDSTFLYFFGLDFPSLAAVVDLDENRDLVFGNDLTVDDIIWMGTQPTLKEKCEKAGIEHAFPSSKLEEVLKKAQSLNRKIHFLPPYRPEHLIKLQSLIGLSTEEARSQASIDFIQAVVAQRNIKTSEEVEEISKAADVTADMHITAIKMARPGMVEAEIAAAVTEVALASGGNLSFPVILTVHGETLHNHYHGNVLESGQMVLNDSGAETAMHYGADFSRTFPVDKKFTAKQKEIYQIALTAHEAAVQALKPGVMFKEIHLMACRTLVEGLKSVDLMRGDPEEAVSRGAHALFFPCGLGHMIGLDIHDMENLGEKYVGYGGQEKSTQFGLKSLRLARELEPGFVLTIEPGIYFIPELIDLWKSEGKFTGFINYETVESYKDFGGLRSEENFLITETGHRMLGKPVPKTIEDIESLR